MRFKHRICPFSIYTQANHRHRPAVHSNDVIHIDRSACQARSAFTRLNSFPLLSLRYHPSASPLTFLFPCFFRFILQLSMSSSHALFSSVNPVLCWLTLFNPLFSCPFYPLAFGGYRLLVSFRQISWLFSPSVQPSAASHPQPLTVFLSGQRH